MLILLWLYHIHEMSATIKLKKEEQKLTQRRPYNLEAIEGLLLPYAG